MNQKDICLKLIAAQSEAEVSAIIASVPEMNDPRNWTPLDRRETNYNVTTNQQASGPKAATELMTNMVDAILLKAAQKAGIDPKAPDAPQSVYAAVAKFFNLKGGRMVNEDDKNWLADFSSKNLVVAISGARNNKEGLPCYTFADNGEGQNAEGFEDTFLSLSSGNKKDVPFVQGKFNMGSSGVLSYCGECWYKLIVSKKWNSKGDWGWTIVRRRPGDGMPIAEYFKPGEIPTANMSTIYPLSTRNKERYPSFSLTTGTIVKLYDFHVGASFMGFKGAREALNENLADTILPFRILDLRQTPTTGKGSDRALGVDARPFYGMEYLLRKTHNDPNVELAADEDEAAADDEKIGVETVDHPSLGRIEIYALRLKSKLPEWLKGSNNRVFHAVNGQVQFKQTRGFLTTCKLPALKDRVVIIVDASGLTDAAHNDVWKADRESVRETGKGGLYKQFVKEAIEKSEVLHSLQNEIAREELKTAVDERSNDLFQKLVDNDKTLAALLGSRSPAISILAKSVDGNGKGSGKGSGDGPGDDDAPFAGTYSPSFLTAENRFRKSGAAIPINRPRAITFVTDVRNDYLVRDENQGRLLLTDTSLIQKFVIRRSLRNGRLTVTLTPIEGQVNVGDTFVLEIGLADDAMPAPVSDRVEVVIAASELIEPHPHVGGKNKKTKGTNAEPPNVGLPSYKLLTADGRIDAGQQTEQWPEWMTDEDGGFVEDLAINVKMYKINIDNKWLQSYRRAQRGQILKDSMTQKYILGMRIFLLGIERALSGMSDDDDIDPDVFRRVAAKGAASTMLTLSDHLPKIIMPISEPE